MNTQAQNALLKTLEEPPPGTLLKEDRDPVSALDTHCPKVPGDAIGAALQFAIRRPRTFMVDGGFCRQSSRRQLKVMMYESRMRHGLSVTVTCSTPTKRILRPWRV
jgi:hypothetical protein